MEVKGDWCASRAILRIAPGGCKWIHDDGVLRLTGLRSQYPYGKFLIIWMQTVIVSAFTRAQSVG
jgi:hypothetical protein